MGCMVVISSIRDHSSPYGLAPFQHPHDDALTASVTAFFLNAGLAVLMHVPRLAADVGFINFHFAAKHPAGKFILHRKANAVKHEPRGFLGYSHSAVKLPGRDAILCVDDEPNYRHPLFQAQGRILKDSPDLGREPAFGMPRGTLPAALGTEETNPITATGGAGHSVRPTPRNEVAQAIVRVSEVDDGFLESGWFFAHVSTLAFQAVLVKYIFTNIFALNFILGTQNTPVGGRLGGLFSSRPTCWAPDRQSSPVRSENSADCPPSCPLFPDERYTSTQTSRSW